MNVKRIDIDYQRIAAAARCPVEDVARSVEIARALQRPVVQTHTVLEDGVPKTLRVTRLGVGPVDTELGRFWQMVFEVNDEWLHYDVLAMADFNLDSLAPKFDPTRPVIVRPDSGCATGQLFLDRTCDCREQLQLTMQMIAEAGQGIIIHMPAQDGRGKGLGFKLATLWIQERLGIDTVLSASMLATDGFIDVRTYAGPIAILKALGLTPLNQVSHQSGASTTATWTLRLATNNPKKARVFVENGYMLADYQPVAIPPTRYTIRHFEAKKALLGHAALLPDRRVA